MAPASPHNNVMACGHNPRFPRPISPDSVRNPSHCSGGAPNHPKWVPGHPPKAISTTKRATNPAKSPKVGARTPAQRHPDQEIVRPSPQTTQSGCRRTRPSPFRPPNGPQTPPNRPKRVPGHPPNAIPTKKSSAQAPKPPRVSAVAPAERRSGPGSQQGYGLRTLLRNFGPFSRPILPENRTPVMEKGLPAASRRRPLKLRSNRARRR